MKSGNRPARPKQSRVWIAGAALMLAAACAPSVKIGSLLAEPHRYEGKTVKVAGTVTRATGLFGTGAFEVDDGTGQIVVIAQGQGVPVQGASTRVKGRFQSVFSWAGRTVAAIVQPGR